MSAPEAGSNDRFRLRTGGADPDQSGVVSVSNTGDEASGELSSAIVGTGFEITADGCHGARLAAHGRDVGPDDITSGVPPGLSAPAPAQQAVKMLDRQGELIAIGEPGESPGLLHPSIVLV